MSEHISFDGHPVRIRSGKVELNGDMSVPDEARGIVLFAHGSGSGRMSPRNRYVAGVIQEAGIAALLMDLLTSREEEEDAYTGEHRYNIPLLAERLQMAADWLSEEEATRSLKVCYFGASTGAAAALTAATDRPANVAAIVSRGGRPDLAGEVLPDVKAPTMLIVGGLDDVVVQLNREAFRELRFADAGHGGLLCAIRNDGIRVHSSLGWPSIQRLRT